MASQKKKIEFTASPTGRMGLAYHTGDVVSLPARLADEACKLNLARPAKQSEKESET
ncbi:MAG: hypothetical protein RI842_11060 [Schleiferiaceae bacterium]|nr:hypothetical protein [Schleiferiaceae bacterium]